MSHQLPDGGVVPPGGPSYSVPTSSPAAQPHTGQLPAQQIPVSSPPISSPPVSSPPQPSPVSAPPGPGNGGYQLGVDLGTSHTVAVVRWPDGRTRPLLVDGAPVMPSAVFLDESMTMHVGRDAQRLAQIDPARYEPNPKQRIGEPSVLLGDQDVPTTALLSAILRTVAAKAVESVGHLPPTVLTFPAKWPAQRRSALEDAAAQAGFPPVRLVPEPVAAAHFFAEVMQQPIAVGDSVGVFDFGGGTLDVAVVRRDSESAFTVLADGGLADLGGLDIDAALVEHLGRTISANAPQLWQQLSQPATGTDRRHRRLFWDDVRGAKEMLSRTTVAPIPVPSVEASLHLTRDELERLAAPMLDRAVAETQRVIEQAKLAPEQLAGLFLVGGASRIPLVSRLLHTRLGIAPTVLEQPEIPVAEGSIAAAFPAEPTTPQPVAAPVSPATGVVSAPTEPVTPPNHAEGFLPPPAPATPWYRRRSNWIGITAAVVVLAVLAWWIGYDPYPQRDMNRLTTVGQPVPIPGASDGVIPELTRPVIRDQVAYYGAISLSSKLQVTAIDLTTGSELWTTDELSGTDFDSINGGPSMLYARDAVDFDNFAFTFLDPETGEKRGTVTVPYADYQLLLGDTFVNVGMETGTVTGYDADGEEQWRVDSGITITGYGPELRWSSVEEARGSGEAAYGPSMYVRDDEGTVVVIDADSGTLTTSATIGTTDDVYQFYEGTVFVADDAAPTLSTFDATKDLESIDTTRTGNTDKARAITVCGETRVCVLTASKLSEETGRLTMMDFGSDLTVIGSTPSDVQVAGTDVAGETIAVAVSDGSDQGSTMLYDEDMEQIGETVTDVFWRIDSGSFLRMPWDSTSTSTASIDFVGLGARDGTVYELGSLDVVPNCDATDRFLVCPTETGYRVWKFRD